MYLGHMILSKNDNWLINWWKTKKDFVKIKFHLNGNIDDIACNLNLIQIHWIPIQQFDWKIILKKSHLCNLNSIQIQLKRNLIHIGKEDIENLLLNMGWKKNS
jgi:hypothetical protein